MRTSCGAQIEADDEHAKRLANQNLESTLFLRAAFFRISVITRAAVVSAIPPIISIRAVRGEIHFGEEGGGVRRFWWTGKCPKRRASTSGRRGDRRGARNRSHQQTGGACYLRARSWKKKGEGVRQEVSREARLRGRLRRPRPSPMPMGPHH